MILQLLNKKEIQRKARAFFNSKGWKDTLVFFSFVGLASCFWALQYFRQKFDFEVPIEVHYTHIPAGLALQDNPPQTISLHVQDKGIVYLNYLFKQKKHPLSIAVDLGLISPYKNSYVIDQTTLRNLIDAKLFASTQLQLFSPDVIEINYSPLAQKEVPVTINGTIAPAFGYLFDSIWIEPAKVVIYGNKAALDTLHEIRTLPLNYKDIDKNWTTTTGIQAPEGIHSTVENVKLSALVEEYTEKTFELPVICNNIPPNRNVRFFPSMVELVVRVGLSKYSQLTKSNFEISLNYNDLSEKNTSNCSLTLIHKPVGVVSYSINPNVIEFLIEQKNE